MAEEVASVALAWWVLMSLSATRILFSNDWP